MPQTIVQVATISLILIAIVFYLVGFLRFRTSRLTESNSISTYGTLVGFRQYDRINQWSHNSEDYVENKAGRVPIVEFNLEGEMVDIAASKGYYALTKDDIGKQVRIRYRRLIGITMIIDDAQSVKNYNQLQNTLFWIFMITATIVLLLGILAPIVLPKCLVA